MSKNSGISSGTCRSGSISRSACSPSSGWLSKSARGSEPMDNDVVKLFALFLVFGGGFWVLRPLAAAIAKRIASNQRRPPETDSQEREAMAAEVQQLRQEMTELQERVDFAERLLAKPRGAARLAPPALR